MSDDAKDQTPAPEPADTGKSGSDSKDSLAPAEPAPPGGPLAVGQGKLSASDDRTFGMLAHLLGAFTLFVGPLIIWQIKREDSPFVDDQGKEALNWQIGISIVFLGLMIFSFGIAILSDLAAACLGKLGYLALVITNLIFCILACVEANNGKVYRYPVNLRLIK